MLEKPLTFAKSRPSKRAARNSAALQFHADALCADRGRRSTLGEEWDGRESLGLSGLPCQPVKDTLNALVSFFIIIGFNHQTVIVDRGACEALCTFEHMPRWA